MMLRTLLLSVAAPALALGGCAATGTENRGLESVHQPVVQQQDYAFDVTAGPAGLAPGEVARVADWFATMRLGYGDRITVDDPSGYGPRVHTDVAREAARFGLMVDQGAPVTAEAVPPGSVRVIVSRAVASVPGCPDFTRYAGADYENHTTSNYGCAMNTNLAAMVANPMDLVRGAPGSEVYDPRLGAKAIDSYRKAAPTGGGGTAVKAEGAGGK
ncbi:CpaD family pilus assembly protein [Sphingomonas sp.]|jgi:pilus assembly protein CpaD|uniref:CpaD family pilus assembly protein n=1 Tax=Sphingomonas sp. TaxID=28214 RepID=UPI0035C82321